MLTGTNRSNLSILERHFTYSLIHEKTSTILYIMEYGRPVTEQLSEIVIKDVLNRFVNVNSNNFACLTN